MVWSSSRSWVWRLPLVVVVVVLLQAIWSPAGVAVVAAAEDGCQSSQYLRLLVPCSGYVMVGNNSSPNPACCQSISTLSNTSIECFCSLVNAMENFNTASTNSSRAEELPRLCNATLPGNATSCSNVTLASGKSKGQPSVAFSLTAISFSLPVIAVFFFY